MSDVAEGFERSRIRIPHLSINMPLRKAASLAAVSVLAAGGLGYGLLHTSLFTIDHINITGIHQLTDQDVQGLAKVHPGEFLINVHGGSVAHRLETNPWVASTSVEVRWPHTLDISIQERAPLAVAQTSDKRWAIIGEGGVVLSVVTSPPAGLPNALGVQAPAQPGARLEQSAADLVLVAGTMPDSLSHRVVQMQETNGVIRLGLDSGTIVIIGNVQDLGDKLTAAAAVLSHSDPSKIAQLDVQSPQTPLVTPTGSGRTAASTSTSTTNSSSTTQKSTTSQTSTTLAKVSTTSTTSVTRTTVKNTPSTGQMHLTTTTVNGISKD